MKPEASPGNRSTQVGFVLQAPYNISTWCILTTLTVAQCIEQLSENVPQKSVLR